MGEPDDPSLLQSVKSKAKALGLGRHRDPHSVLPTHSAAIDGTSPTRALDSSNNSNEKTAHHNAALYNGGANHNNVADNTSSSPPPPAPPPTDTAAAREGTAAVEPKPPMSTRIKNGIFRFGNHTKNAITHSWVNVLLIFVPIGIAIKPAGLAPEIVFAMNAIAIIPLAGLLAHATEAVATRLGDTLGALLNVSFGNAVELILFIILLAGDQIRVVQAALLGSILANLLLILGMAFVLGGLRYQEQIYNSTVTQMSACMLSLAVMSLLLPTAFHAAFNSYSKADKETLYVSRGTSVVLLLVYVLYLVFQLKSHSYMYASTPQHIIDEESHPGVLAGVLDSSSSSDSSSDSSSTNSDSTASSTTTAKRIKRAFRNRKRRKSSASSKDTPSAPSVMSSPSVENHKSYFESQRHGSGSNDNEEAVQSNPISRRASFLNAIMSGDEADTDDATHNPVVRDFEAGSSGSPPNGKREKKVYKHKKHRKHRTNEKQEQAQPIEQQPEPTPKVAFSDEVQQSATTPGARRPFAIRPALPSLLSNNVFNNPQNPPPAPGGALSNVRIAGPRSLRRTASLPDRINRMPSQQSTHNASPELARQPSRSPAIVPSATDEVEEAPVMSRTAAIVMLLISTGLVAVCADFMTDAIEPMVEKTGISEAFIGLIILPIVGNAAEHVTAVTVAAKNKMDLAIGVAVGSSIQIAIFITPFVVILGWIMGKEMSLYFNIFETVALFVTAFVVNFLVLDGRSNYLEGSLLIAAYIIIALASFFYPDGCDASQIGGQEGVC
ncbi:hypothetical protein EJ04DRAFT_450205 [Polyplosphaeria fusca]|uniref:Sodium/calcium exchanger membrane region domain-containing protein n=1 Tax=Polyplosphaeria fusca TaxID=682080 RepID=A0A9P4QN55_9PLEO|nr:hypothetical protein EJ04DRAFT_450205 [Polyplosphaeria fusca]